MDKKTSLDAQAEAASPSKNGDDGGNPPLALSISEPEKPRPDETQLGRDPRTGRLTKGNRLGRGRQPSKAISRMRAAIAGGMKPDHARMFLRGLVERASDPALSVRDFTALAREYREWTGCGLAALTEPENENIVRFITTLISPEMIVEQAKLVVEQRRHVNTNSTE